MKHKIITITVCLLMLSVSAEAQVKTNNTQQQPTVSLTLTGDVRIVSGIQVSLEPIHEWELNKKKGERPLKHWKYISFEDYLGVINGGHCFNVTVDGNKKSILLQNPPSSVLTLATRVRNLQAQLGRATYIAGQAEANKTVHEGRVSDGWYASGSSEWVAVAYQEAILKQNAANAKALAQLTESQRRQLEHDYMTASLDFHSTKELAMFTGRIIMQRELWDVGLKK